jgi:hypothetical protein
MVTAQVGGITRAFVAAKATAECLVEALQRKQTEQP